MQFKTVTNHIKLMSFLLQWLLQLISSHVEELF